MSDARPPGVSHPIQVEVDSPSTFEPIQLLLRGVLAIGLGWIGVTAGWLNCVLYLGLPVLAAVAVSTRGAPAYLESIGPRLWRALTWLLSLSAYMLLLTDRFPVGDKDGVRVGLHAQGTPTVGSTLMRLLTSIPSALVLGLLSIASFVLLVIGAAMVVARRPIPAFVTAFQRGYLQWQARLVAYHASLVTEYPPFSFEDNPASTGGPLSAAPHG